MTMNTELDEATQAAIEIEEEEEEAWYNFLQFWDDWGDLIG